jgi:hypothetical protein
MTLTVRRNAACEFSQQSSTGGPVLWADTCMTTVVQDPLFPDPASCPSPVISSILAQSRSAEQKRSVLPIFVSIPLSIDRRVAPAPVGISAPYLRNHEMPSSPRFCTSPLSRLQCNGWCVPGPNPNIPTVVGFISVCSVLLTSLIVGLCIHRFLWQHAQIISGHGRPTMAR